MKMWMSAPRLDTCVERDSYEYYLCDFGRFTLGEEQKKNFPGYVAAAIVE